MRDIDRFIEMLKSFGLDDDDSKPNCYTIFEEKDYIEVDFLTNNSFGMISFNKDGSIS